MNGIEREIRLCLCCEFSGCEEYEWGEGETLISAYRELYRLGWVTWNDNFSMGADWALCPEHSRSLSVSGIKRIMSGSDKDFEICVLYGQDEQEWMEDEPEKIKTYNMIGKAQVLKKLELPELKNKRANALLG